jgi:hypothetical protein
MKVILNKNPGIRNDLLIVIPLSEIDDVIFQIANRDKLVRLPGLMRHVPEQEVEERKAVNSCKITVEEHLRVMSKRGPNILEPSGKPLRRLIVIGSRNVGSNHGFVAWQREETPKLFHVKGDPLNYNSYSCLTKYKDGQISIRCLRVKNDSVIENEKDITDKLTWCVYGNQVLRNGQIVPIEEIIDQFYDIRHVLAFDRNSDPGRQIEADIFKGYPELFRKNALRALHEGVPRNRFLHNGLGLSDDSLIILQREGTIEEVAHRFKEAGANDAIILDNGASVFFWVWWLYPKGGFLFSAPDFRPPCSAVVAFVLKGPAATYLPEGSVSFTVV